MLDAFDLLPSKYQDLVRSFDSLDRLYCFLTKRKLPATFSRLKLLYNEFNKLNTPNTATNATNDQIPSITPTTAANTIVFNIDNLCHICGLCPEHIQIRICTTEDYSMRNTNSSLNSDDHIELELYFPVNASASAFHSKIRRKTLVDKLFHIIACHHHCESMKNDPSCDLDKKVKVVRKKGWPIDINQIDCMQLLPSLSRDVQILVHRYYRQSSTSTSPSSSWTTTALSVVTPSPIPLYSESMDIRPISIDAMGGAKAVLAYLQTLPNYRDQLKHVEVCRSKEAVYAEIAPPAINTILMHRLRKVLKLEKGLYRHQVKGIDALRQGRHVVVSTSTASGKSLIYNIPILETMLHDRQATALYIFPTKALAQDQLRSLRTLIHDDDDKGSSLPVRVSTCDGDTGAYERSDIQAEGLDSLHQDNTIDATATSGGSGPINIILTNPDMLHCTMLPDHVTWRRIYQHLRYVVIDESHMYGGIFGANVAAVLRRLVRVCLYYQHNIPQFICCSATIANPLSHMMKLIPLDCVRRHDSANEDVVVVDSNDDGAPQCERYISYHHIPDEI